MSYPVHRYSDVARSSGNDAQAEDDNDSWIYIREWRCLNHPMDGLRLVAELTNSVKLSKRAALNKAEKLKVDEALDEQILRIWENEGEQQ